MILGFGVPLASTSVVAMDYWGACCDMLVYTLKNKVFKDIHTFRVSSSDVSLNRNKIWKMAKEKGCDYLLMIDDDMVFNKDVVRRLMALERVMPDCVYTGFAAVGGKPYYPAFWTEGSDGKGQILWDYPKDRAFEVHFIGGYGFLVPPNILYSKKMPEDPFTIRDGRSEDHSFSKCVRDAGFRLLVEPRIVFGHLRLRPITAKDWEIYKQDLDESKYAKLVSK